MMEQIKGVVTREIRCFSDFKELRALKWAKGCYLVLLTPGYHSSQLKFSDIFEMGLLGNSPSRPDNHIKGTI